MASQPSDWTIDATKTDVSHVNWPYVSNLTFEDAAQLIVQLNGTLPEVACTLMERTIQRDHDECRASFDGLICWPATLPNSLAVLPCLAEIKGIEYNTTQNVSRWCHGNGTWDYTDYSACREVQSLSIEQQVEITTTIYFVGYITSLIALTVAMWIFIYFKDLRCLRNIIHTNLMCTYILTDFFWILTLTLQMSVETNMATCILLMIMLHYFHLTNFFWMFVEGCQVLGAFSFGRNADISIEARLSVYKGVLLLTLMNGLYLYMLVVETFTGENIKFRVYASIGWGCPVIFILLWALVKAFTNEGNSQIEPVDNLWKQCPWMRPHTYDWIYQAPAIGILLINLIFLFVIMWVLITKLRSAQTVETQQYRKAAKALLVLIPLLGITYVLVIAGPTQGLYKNIYEIIRAVLISTQGFTVALFYCFLNTEVQNTLRHHKERWKTARSFRGSRRNTYSGHSKDWSPRSRTESIRLYTQPSTRKRESTASEITTTTLVNVNGGTRLSNGSQVRTTLVHAGGMENAV